MIAGVRVLVFWLFPLVPVVGLWQEEVFSASLGIGDCFLPDSTVSPCCQERPFLQSTASLAGVKRSVSEFQVHGFLENARLLGCSLPHTIGVVRSVQPDSCWGGILCGGMREMENPLEFVMVSLYDVHGDI